MQIHIQIMWDYTYWLTTACTPGFGFCPEVIQEGCWHCQEPCEAQARCQSQVKKVQVQNRSLNIRMWLFQYYILGKISQCHVVSAVRSSYGICHLCSSWFIFIITCKQVHPLEHCCLQCGDVSASGDAARLPQCWKMAGVSSSIRIWMSFLEKT